jgi:hypothetical protein
MEPETRRIVWMSQELYGGYFLRSWFRDVLLDNASDETQRLDAQFDALDQTLVAWRGGDRTIFEKVPRLRTTGPILMRSFKENGSYTSLDRFLQYLFRLKDEALREILRGVVEVSGGGGGGRDKESSTPTEDRLLSAIYPDEPSLEACLTRFLERNLREAMLRDLDSEEEDGVNRRVGIHSRVKGLQLLEQTLWESGVYTREPTQPQPPIEAVPASGGAPSGDIGTE